MDYIEEFVDERKKTMCIHCGRPLNSVEINSDHVPSKSLLLKPYPTNLPVIQICKPCNEGFSLDEEYLSTFLSCVLVGSTVPKNQHNPKIASTLRNKPKLRAQIEKAKTEYNTLSEKPLIRWKPEEERISHIILKNARGHIYFEYGESMLEKPDNVWFAPLESLTERQRLNFESINTRELFPEVGSRMLTRVATGKNLSENWVVVQDGTYRYLVAQSNNGGMFTRSVLSEYLATQVYWDYDL